jgi:hypothetical protein
MKEKRHLQWPKAFENLPVTGEVLAAVPNRGVLLASGLKDFEALGDAVQKALRLPRAVQPNADRP